ncbi:MAG TPA: GMP synthase [Parasegetibacter sp.]
MPDTKRYIRIALLDLYAGEPNEGMRCLRQIMATYSEQHQLSVEIKEFECRLAEEIPDLSFDIYISSGGPGDPTGNDASHWEEKYFNWISEVLKWNTDPCNKEKKHVFFICHSFQMACRFFNVAIISKRKSPAFGVFPVHRLDDGQNDQIFKHLHDPFFVVDSREYQVLQPNYNELEKLNGRILAIEKERPHVPLERAVMAMRFNQYMVGTQFHPEADAVGMARYLQSAEKKRMVIENYGIEKWKDMLLHLNDPDKILWTYKHIIPNFLDEARGI